MNTMGDEADDILQFFKLSTEDQKTVKSKFDQHFVKKSNVITLKAGRGMAVRSHGSVVRAPAAKAGGPGCDPRQLPCFFFFQLAYTNSSG